MDSSSGQKQPTREETADDFKDKGNLCIKDANYAEAILHYTQAIKLSPNDPILYSNRSLAFLKFKQYYYAYEDAEKSIQLKPDWAKGYFRRAAVQTVGGQYDSALLSYGRALLLQPNDVNIILAAKQVATLSSRDNLYNTRIPWAGAGLGIFVGCAVVIADHVMTSKPALTHPVLMLLLVLAISLIGFSIAKGCRYYIKLQRKVLLDPPIDLLEDFQKEEPQQEETTEQTTNRTRYSKAQARQRFKKGKT